jgi:hypothetical protein
MHPTLAVKFESLKIEILKSWIGELLKLSVSYTGNNPLKWILLCGGDENGVLSFHKTLNLEMWAYMLADSWSSIQDEKLQQNLQENVWESLWSLWINKWNWTSWNN